jgi:hypothetical protein
MFYFGKYSSYSLSRESMEDCIQITSPAWISPKSSQSVSHQSMAATFPSKSVDNDPRQQGGKILSNKDRRLDGLYKLGEKKLCPLLER